MAKYDENYKGYYDDQNYQRATNWELRFQNPPEDSKYIGKRRLPIKEGYEKASGTAQYTGDVILQGRGAARGQGRLQV